MSDSTINRDFERISVTSVRDIQVSEIVEESGTFYRSIKVFGEPVLNGTPTMKLDIRLTSDVEADLKLSTPELNY